MRNRLMLGVACLFLLPNAAFAADFSSVAELPFHTTLFLAVTAALTVYFAAWKFDRFAVAHGPEILTTLGILGCFLGVSLGLLAFDTKDIGASVPRLLEGIKTAFLASLAGISGALVIKFRHAVTTQPIPQSSDSPKAGSIDDLLAAVHRVQKGVVGDDEGTLLGQVKLMRQDQRDSSKALLDGFNTFATKMAENNSKALVDALREVIRDFNAKINEQFGDNFKQLNAAVEKLVLWQDQYKKDLDTLRNAQEKTAQDMRTAAEAFATLVNRAQVFAELADKLGTLLKVLETELHRTLEVERALHTTLAEMRQVTPTFAEKSSAMLEDIKKGVSRVQGELEAVAKAFATSMQTTNTELRRLLTEAISEQHKQVTAHIRTLSDDTNKQVLALDKALNTELTKSLESLGSQLTALSAKFVEDYMPLTDRLRHVVQIASRV